MASMRYVRGGGGGDGDGSGGQRPGRGGAGGGRNNRWTLSGGRGRGRGGRGRFSSGRGRFSHARGAANAAGNKWVRNDTGESGNDEPRAGEGSGSATADAPDAGQPDTATADFATAGTGDKQQPSLERRGRNKLVLKSDVPQTGSGRAVPISSGDVKHKAIANATEIETAGLVEGTNVPEDNNQPSLERRGRNKLVLKSGGSQPASNDPDAKNPSPEGPRSKRKRVHQSTGPRRIQLPGKASINSPVEGEPTAPDDTQTATGANDAASKASNPEKTLTDFCYKDTGRGRGGRGRGRGRGRGHPSKARGGNLGLVRVKPKDISSTPICPTFRRGLPCKDPKCKLRHDVATEASRPICVFFQRNGMCSRDDCPFRHVKVRWDAEVCPAFAKLGYCEDPDCALRHVVTKKQRADRSSAK